jgi:Trk K+ transport system NAD-binding subunit
MSVIEQELPSSGFLTLMPLTGSHLELIEAEVVADGPSAGKSVRSLGLPRGTAIGGIVRKGAVLHADDDTRLEVGDRLVVLAPTKDEAEVRRALAG